MILPFVAVAALLQFAPTAHAHVTLVAERTALAPGEDNVLGIRFEMDQGWHIFWENPGDAGGPPKVQWKLPAGYTAGALVYPAPDRIQSQSFAIYGYERHALLIAPIHVPKDASGRADITANVRFILCSDVCISAQTATSLALTVGGGAASAAKPLFDDTRAHIPQAPPASWSARAEIGKTEVTVTLTLDGRTARVEVFPLDAGVIDPSSAPHVEPTDRGARVRLKRSDDLIKISKQLTLVVKIAGGKAFKIPAPVTEAR